jgi:hypothetical protein
MSTEHEQIIQRGFDAEARPMQVHTGHASARRTAGA